MHLLNVSRAVRPGPPSQWSYGLDHLTDIEARGDRTGVSLAPYAQTCWEMAQKSREECVMARVGETRFASVRRSDVRSLDGMNGFVCLVRPRGDGG